MDGSPLPESCDGDGNGGDGNGDRRPVAWVRPGRVGYVGPDLGVRMHAPAVAVLTVGLDAPFTLETPDRGPVLARSAFAPARQPHRVIAPEGRILLLFLDSAPSPPDMRRPHGGCALDHRRESELIAAGAAVDGPDPDVLGRVASGHSAPADPRIARLAAALHAADAGFASPSHLSDSFRQALGTTASAVLAGRVRFDLRTG
ncbi:hypothetical protein [Streptacidiphilus cavernicola]|uniref:AraC family transcriptional regulator n=1 Tax=Streptacidiphilus cavernicola TaxID=3342716 RepID=A0ABV6W487_9ACTN